ncbi:ribulose-phosphate 3-epimerase [Allorhodopirellula heiligendammensis]|uniref:Ribulose-phosphate 3-epimerase n=1 Tax=Allorhodopirellula heiligendammensis TaxID=2714739 RepID=A0A5C6BKX8_9BACT|nr:ribulose-phosphate 3-epimerase [Allorhodopirellula heiligendammensis]TWU11114.1 Ribulose-phosphate 3-epimerase [Allorhodopirellula heiligendammensis]
MNRAKLDSIRDAGPAILPSLLQCDFGNLQSEVERLSDAGTSVLHLDVMDGHFVPNLTYGMPVVAGLRRHTNLPLDVHMMISDPLAYAKPMVDAGADMLTFHVEAVSDAVDVAGQIRDLGVGAGLAINPDTPMSQLEPALDCVDMVLVMSVQAGFGGQSFNPVALQRIRDLRSRYPDLLLEIDGGINLATIGAARQAGCDLFVVGSAIFSSDDYGVALAGLNEAMASAQGAK